MNILVTGGAGFIGSWVSKALINRGDTVIIVDNFNDYYDPELKRDRIDRFIGTEKITLYEGDIADYEFMSNIFTTHHIDLICHLAAQAGVRYSLINPYAYQRSNVLGTLTIFELARQFNVPKVVYASSSSVYGGNKKIPFSENDNVDNPISLYAATKKSTELIAASYHNLYNIKTIGLRFFTVYGPWGRPDMALFLFTKAILENKPIDVFNFGNMKRDFTYITDIVSGVLAAIDTDIDNKLFNLGNSDTVELSYFIECIENQLGKKAEKNLLPLQKGDVPETFADIQKAKEQLGFNPKIKIEEGIKNFITWYKEYHGVN